MQDMPIPAQKTMDAIEAALEKDQGASFRQWLGKLIPMCEDAYRGEDEGFRSHLGASLIGRECARELWYSFRWVTKSNFPGRILRLFNRGHLEEARFVALLKMLDCTVWQFDENGDQFRISGHKGHFGGSLDAVILGLPDYPLEPILGEFKTHNDKSFKKVQGDGVASAKWEHYAQMQLYMGKNNLSHGAYFAVNKNDDELWVELVPFDQVTYDRYMERSALIIDSVSPPARISNSPGWFKCKFCDHNCVCHGTALPERNCRTCRWSTPVEDGEWLCESPTLPVPSKLDKKTQLLGCNSYEVHPEIKAKP